MNAPADITRDAREQRIINNVKAVFVEAHAAGQQGKFFSEVWPDSQSRARLMLPISGSMSAIDRRDKTLYFFEEGLCEGHSGASAETSWHNSYSRVIARDMAERARLRAIERHG